eukprot:CAMPEP_0181317182 /NCGR_PEP_ID=MMETSP1101-20121128/16316_1 /TAXON_ID=46948 /ORGANISM="Rhodomonas abbreviata, Strain Caron Lab Isolate" /LENGTH=113 /DNA_ID=CAMNT_0023424527 /DNA_START=54 /DNA_END=395 /DNA_ORIENTATION=+
MKYVLFALIAAACIAGAFSACDPDDLTDATDCVGKIDVTGGTKAADVCDLYNDIMACYPGDCCTDEVKKAQEDAWKLAYPDDDCDLKCGAGFNLQASIAFVFAAFIATVYTSY